MLKKHCPKCGGDSYSSSDRGLWLCPYCREDISRVIPGPAKAGIDIEIDYQKAKELGIENMLLALQALFPEKKLYKISMDWFSSSKYIIKTKGELGDLVVGWKNITLNQRPAIVGAHLAKY